MILNNLTVSLTLNPPSLQDVKSGVSCTSVKQQNALNTSLHKSQERIEVFKECFLNGSLAQELVLLFFFLTVLSLKS